MFRDFMGLPLHPLAVHAAVVLVPLLAAGSAGYAVLPRFRARLGWAVWALAVVTPIAGFVAKESGEQLEQVLTDKHYSAAILEQVTRHAEYADRMFVVTFALAVATVLQLLFVGPNPRARLPRWAAPGLVGVVLVLVCVDLVYVYLTGDSGAKVVWNGVL